MIYSTGSFSLLSIRVGVRQHEQQLRYLEFCCGFSENFRFTAIQSPVDGYTTPMYLMGNNTDLILTRDSFYGIVEEPPGQFKSKGYEIDQFMFVSDVPRPDASLILVTRLNGVEWLDVGVPCCGQKVLDKFYAPVQRKGKCIAK